MDKVQAGDKAPEFSLYNDKYTITKLSDFKGKKNVVLYFYPKDDTPGCTKQAKAFKDCIEDFSAADTVILGMSKDSIESHEKFKKKYDLPFALLSEEDLEAMHLYGVWVEKNMYGKKYMGIERSTFLIDKDQKISHIWRKVRVTGHVEEALEYAQKLHEQQK